MRFYDRTEELQELQEMMRQSFEDHSRLTESYRYADIGGWWLPKQKEPHEIDIVAITLDGKVEAYEVKRQHRKFNPTLLTEKVQEMQKYLFKHQAIRTDCLTLDEMTGPLTPLPDSAQ